MASRKSGGNYRLRKTDNLMELSPTDLENPWNFYSLMTLSDELVYEWLRTQGLLASSVPCVVPDCEGTMHLRSSSRNPGGSIFRCNVDRLHTRNCRANSLFEKTNLSIQDIILFIKSYLDGCSLGQCARFSGVSYNTTAVHWGSYIRELFKEHFHNNIKRKQLSGIIEIDESLFGRRVKHNRGNPNCGLKVINNQICISCRME